ncbi:MAG: saccharopine dehydrogenase, partial [Chitinophagaceae bacterium]|nr:saccharopine dehydrogenase [Chitinophagaceae bacterium]
MQKQQVLLYGANGYTGELIARYASEYNLQPVLAGRKEEKI